MEQGSCGTVRNELGSEALASVLSAKGFKLGPTIGEGSYSKVKVAYRATELGYTQKLACKVVTKANASRDFVKKFLPREISIVKRINHPHITRVFHIIDLEDHVFMFMDMCEKGDLLDCIRLRGHLSESRARLYTRQVVSALEYLHSRDIAHRDLKCENLFLATRDHIKVGDFGFARWCRDMGTGLRALSDTFCGSTAYAAPEVIQGVKYNPKLYDIWSLGCIMYIMLYAAMPFDDVNTKQMLRLQLNKTISFPPKCHVSARAKKLILHLLEPDVTKRATIRQVVVHSWVREDDDYSRTSGRVRGTKDRSPQAGRRSAPIHPRSPKTSGMQIRNLGRMAGDGKRRVVLMDGGSSRRGADGGRCMGDATGGGCLTARKAPLVTPPVQQQPVARRPASRREGAYQQQHQPPSPNPEHNKHHRTDYNKPPTTPNSSRYHQEYSGRHNK